MEEKYNSTIFWIEVGKIKPNPYQPRHEFNEDRLRDLADSIRQYGVLQPLVVTRREVEKEDGGLTVEYELIAGERRLRASKIAGISQVPAVIKIGKESEKAKLEMAIIENLQREDLNPVDRARAFFQLAEEFGLKHTEIAKRVGRSREYVSNTIRMVALPEDILIALTEKKITEGHTKPILMLSDRPAEQRTLFLDIMSSKMTVREAENIARRIAYDRVRKKERFLNPAIIELENKLSEKFGTKVHVDPRENGGKVTIDYFSDGDLVRILNSLSEKEITNEEKEAATELAPELTLEEDNKNSVITVSVEAGEANFMEEAPVSDGEDEDLYSIKNFSV